MTLDRAVARLVRRVEHWTPSRWAASGAAPVLHVLVQRLADLDADVEGLPHRPVPRLDNDLAIPDQVRVVCWDLLAAEPPGTVLAEATGAVAAAAAALDAR